jgi:hypothetical protein
MSYCISNMVVGKGIKNTKQIVSKILAHPVYCSTKLIRNKIPSPGLNNKNPPFDNTWHVSAPPERNSARFCRRKEENVRLMTKRKTIRFMRSLFSCLFTRWRSYWLVCIDLLHFLLRSLLSPANSHGYLTFCDWISGTLWRIRGRCVYFNATEVRNMFKWERRSTGSNMW